MKIIFETSDFPGCGQMIVRDDLKTTDAVKVEKLAARSYKIGYIHHNDGKTYYTRTALNDGQTVLYESKEDLCNFLNREGYSYRPMKDEEIVNVINYIGNRFINLSI